MIRAVAIVTAVAALSAAAAGCEREDLGIDYPVETLNYPVGVTADPGGRLIWVTNGNFDLAYRGGAVTAIDVATHEFATTTDADGEQQAISFMVGGFPGPLHLLERDGQAVAGYVLSRELDALYHVRMWGDPEQPQIDCPKGLRLQSGMLDCGQAGSIQFEEITDSDGIEHLIDLGSDPYGALVHLAGPGESDDLLLTGGMRDGVVASFTLDLVGTPTLVDALDLADGVFTFAESPVTRRIYTTHKLANVFSVLEVVPPDPEEPDAARVQVIGQITLPASEVLDHARELAVSSDGTRLYAAYRSPSSLLVVDISEGADGTPDERVLAKVDVGQRPGAVVVVPEHDDLPELVYVSCFRADRIDVVDPLLGYVVDSIPTGRGPFGMARIDNPALGLHRLYVANFHHETVGVVELDPASPYFHVQVAEIR